MIRFILIMFIGTIVFSCTDTSQKESSKQKPNLLLIFTDQQTWRAMSCAGNPHLKTPAMDRLASNGVLFENAYCTSPVCAPGRSSLVTGLMPHTTGVDWNGQSIHENISNMGEIFREHGYRTVWGGKWHLHEGYPLMSGVEGENKIIKGFEVLPFCDSTKGLFDYWMYGDTTDGPLADAVVEFLKQPQDKPFLMGISFHNPHDCCFLTRTPDRYPNANKIESVLPPLPPNYEIQPDEPEFTMEKRTENDHYGLELLLSKNWGEEEWRAYLWNYYRMTERVDDALDQVLNALYESGKAENTVVIFTSDHGDGAASHRWTTKLSLYDESARIPFIISWPGQIPEGIVDAKHLVSQIDVLPTFLDYAEIEEQSLSLQGLSLKTIIDDPNAEWREYVITELADDNLDSTRKGRMVRTKQYKYNVYSHGARNEQLFDLKYDPGETQNLINEPSMQEIVKQHKDYLQVWMQKTNDNFELPDNF